MRRNDDLDLPWRLSAPSQTIAASAEQTFRDAIYRRKCIIQLVQQRFIEFTKLEFWVCVVTIGSNEQSNDSSFAFHDGSYGFISVFWGEVLQKRVIDATKGVIFCCNQVCGREWDIRK